MGKEEDQHRIEPVDMMVMKTAVKRLNFGALEERGEAAAEIGRLARSDGRTKRLLAELGVVPPLVSMLVDPQGDQDSRLAAAGALLELARGTYRNKVLMVKAGLLKKLPQLMDNKDLSRTQHLSLLLLSISSLAKTDFPFTSSQIVPFLITTLNADDVTPDTKLSCLATLYNLSRKLENTRDIISNGAVHALLTPSLDKKTSEVALSILGNLVLSAAGKKDIEENEMVPRAFVEVMTWHENTRCQEHATYLVMVLAHGSQRQRQKMRQLGVVQVLLEVALLGSPLAQKRALKILQRFKDEGQRKIRSHSGPRMEDVPRDGMGGGDGQETRDCRRAVSRMVKQSLDRNMTSILRRATASVDLTNVKSLVASSSSKSLPC